MKTTLKNTTLLLLSTMVLLMTACGPPKDEPTPELPEAQSFLMDFGQFEDGKVQRTAGMENFAFAGINVLVWNVVIYVGSAVPVAAFLESFNHQAEWDRKLKRWVWEYDVTVAARRYTVQLQGHISGGFANWELHVSQQGGFQNFVYYTGQTALDRTSATWTLNREPSAPTPAVLIEYENDFAGNRQIRYTNIIQNDVNNGGYIEYRVTTDIAFDRYYDIYSQENDNLTEIKWSSMTNEGRVKDELHFGDTDFHCWDSQYMDVVCQ